MSSVTTGRKAEQVAAEFLEYKGCEILACNWRTRWCEIDIVALRDQVVYFCEVKYRRTALQGVGLDYVTPKKLQQMCFAAAFWMAQNNQARGYELCVIEVSGPAFRITNVIKDIVL